MLSCNEVVRSAKGFAYLWTLMLVALLGLALVTVSELYSFESRRERERELLFVGHQFRAALRSYYLNGGATAGGSGLKEHPVRMEDLLSDPRYPGIRRHLRRIFRDPLMGTTEWGVVRVSGRIVGVHSLSDDEPIKVDGFEAEDSAFRHKKSYRDWVFAYPENQLILEGVGLDRSNAHPSGATGILTRDGG